MSGSVWVIVYCVVGGWNHALKCTEVDYTFPTKESCIEMVSHYRRSVCVPKQSEASDE